MVQITLKDIAKALNLSPSTVSRAMKDHPAISANTRALVQAYAEAHRYKPNTLAMQLRTNRNTTIGVIVPEIVHYFFSTVLAGIQQEAGFDRRLAFFEKDEIDWSDPQGFGNFYRELNTFKKQNKALLAPERDGEMTEINNDQPGKVWSFKRMNEGDEVVCLFNFSKERVKIAFTEMIPGEGYVSFPDSTEVTAVKELNLNPWEYRIFYK